MGKETAEREEKSKRKEGKRPCCLARFVGEGYGGGGGGGGVKRAAARRNSSLALIALGGLLSIMSGNRWLTQFPAARFVCPA